MPNRLINESSPYLLQHANNPVDWFPYGEEAFAEARNSNRPVLISIGYSACHWCHVMEHESFSKPEIADVMNRLFVCIKVDREERPDVDQVYMNAVQLLHNSGGWPLNCFALPDGRPFWGGTYFRPSQWTDLLEQISDLYHKNRNEIEQQAKRLREGIEGLSLIERIGDEDADRHQLAKDAYEQLAHRFDENRGGLIGAPKFPMPVVWEFVLRSHMLMKQPGALDHLKLTIDHMSRGGIFDQAGGGFCRYSTDAGWKVPHFEKMLYDNAQMVSLISGLYRATGDENLSVLMHRTLAFVERELTSPEGAFYAALDADSEGEEGKFYVWTKDEIIQLLPEYGELLCEYWGIGGEGVWEKGKNILIRPLTDEVFASRQHLSAEELKQLVRMAAGVLLSHRNQRVRPGLDDKVLASWNGLMIKAYAAAYRATGQHSYMNAALKAARFIKTAMIQPGGSILRSWKNGTARINGVLPDYAFLADAFTELYQICFDEQWLFDARELTDYAIDHFSDPETGLFWYTSVSNGNDPGLIPVLDTSDGVEPSGNAVMAGTLLYLGHFFSDGTYIGRAGKMANLLSYRMASYPSAYARWASVTAEIAHEITTLIITGPDALNQAREFMKKTAPGTLLAASTGESRLPVFSSRFRDGETLFYQCRGNVCLEPVNAPALVKL